MGKTDKATLQYALAALAIVGAIAHNIWGTPSVMLDNLFTTIITATVWGGFQRQQGKKEGGPK